MALLTRRDRTAVAVIMTLIVTGWGVRYYTGIQDDDPVTVYHDVIPVPATLTDGNGGGAAGLFQPVDINHATRDELMQLPMIGPVKADAIIEYREAHGGFGTTEEILDVPGIGPATFERIRGDIGIGEVLETDLPAKTTLDNEK